MSKDVLICGSIAFDTIAVFEGRFRDHILADSLKSLSVSFFAPLLRKEYGGCAGNIAYSLKLLGGQPVPVGTVGQDADDYLQRLRDLGIDTRLVRVLPDTFTAQCHIITDQENNQIASFHPGAMLRSAENDLSGNAACWAIVSPDAKDGMFAHAQRLQAAGIPFIFDLGQAMPLFDGDDLRRMLGMADILTANDYEASVIEERTGRTLQELAAGLQAVVVTRGADGASLFVGDTCTDIPPAPVTDVVDPTGCGDAHRAGLLYGLAHDWSLRDACCLANVMGGLKSPTEVRRITARRVPMWRRFCRRTTVSMRVCSPDPDTAPFWYLFSLQESAHGDPHACFFVPHGAPCRHCRHLPLGADAGRLCQSVRIQFRLHLWPGPAGTDRALWHGGVRALRGHSVR